MANTVNESGNVIEISAIDEDWDPDSNLNVQFIKFVPGQANDICVMKAADDSGPECFRANPTDAEPRIVYYGGTTLRPYLDYSACTLNTGAKVIIVLSD